MKPSGFLIAFLLIAITISSSAQEGVKFAKLDPSPADISLLRLEKDAPVAIKVVYGRPQKKGRVVFGTLVPFGQVWRTGANEASEITFYKDTNFGGKAVKAGTYTLFTIPGETEWTIILNKSLNAWGAYSYIQADDVLRFTVKPASSEDELEAFSIAFDNGVNKALVLGWDKTSVSIPIKF